MPEVSTGFTGLLYFVLATLLTITIDSIRRIVKRRLDIWEANNPVPKPPKKRKKGSE